ncbi:AdoMet-MTase [Halovirus HCTV-5]|uniref:DNA methyltransferase n=1 Tax=Halovirus HCTV-5 TaxID=1273748 RepID=UPI0003348745|nr:DNA methyltransferase [Halovirus HCTV-5]AGM11658.1 AdoMet-MTase [Halovirus HCTV-5]
MSKIYPFTYFGSQYRSCSFILEHLPITKRYVEPFGGSATILCNRTKVEHETYNDVEKLVTDFFEVLRDDAEELIRKLELTPYSRNEFERAVELESDGIEKLEKIERARLFFVLCEQGRYSRMFEARSKGEWARTITQIRGESPLDINKYRNKIEQLAVVAERFSDVQIENRDAIKLLEEYDAEETVFYLDPPYPVEVRENSEGAYGSNEFSDEDHEELLSVARNMDGYVGISSYDSQLYRTNLTGWNVYKDDAKTNQNGPSGNKQEHSVTQEVLFTNYDASRIGGVDMREDSRGGGTNVLDF